MRPAFLLLLPILALAQTLPPPAKSGGKPLMDTLAARSSSRAFAEKPLPPQILSNLLWAAYGVNRPDTGGRTAPSAHNWQAVDIYVALPSALYLYNAKSHSLVEVARTDAREIAGTQDFVASAPVNLIFVANTSKTKLAAGDTESDRIAWLAAEAGAVSQNVYLFCASEGLATVVRAGVQREAFAKAAKLPPGSLILLAQTVGYPR